MKPSTLLFIFITLAVVMPGPLESFAQHDALGPVLGLTILLTIIAFIIFALPVKTRR
jgi:low affinity Fe/Cu permease